ncbi:MAG: BrnA antitoxin family protein [Desulfamplus sp.]|nr:BrnA antitoxin family protein [Desulfamplus sp.]
MNRQPLIDDDGEVRELTSEDFKRMRPISEFPELQFLVKRDRPPEQHPKTKLTIQLDSVVVDFFKAHGEGWQTEINAVLHKYVESKSTYLP